MVHECVMCMCDVVETVQREVKRIQRRFLWWPTEEREGGRRAEQRGLKSLCLPSWSSGFGSKAES